MAHRGNGGDAHVACPTAGPYHASPWGVAEGKRHMTVSQSVGAQNVEGNSHTAPRLRACE